MPSRWSRLAALPCVLACLMTASPARADLPLFPSQPPACPPNSSCAPGTPPATPPGTCGPGNGGATCGGAGPATLGSGTGVNVGAGNPINVINGNKYQREVDMAPLPGTLGLEIVRHYNSTSSRPGASTNLVGRGWKLSYETELYATGRTLQVVQADGTRIIFSRDARDPSQCASADPAHGTIDIVKGAHGDEYVWHWTNGRELRFDTRGHLTQILAPGGQFVSLQHDSAGLLVKVTDPQGRSLNLTYLDKASARAGDAFRGVQTITSPVGKFTYHYGSPMPQGAQIDKQVLLANLVRVDMPTGSRYYHYEDARFPTLLTGISELATDAGHHLAWHRVSTYGYDANGKGNLSVRGRPAALARDAHGAILRPARLVAGTGIDQVTLDFSKGGQTTVTNERGQATVFRHAVIGGEYRLLEVRGPGCTNCGPSNVRYRYDAQGKLAETTTLDAAGTPLAGMRTDFDARGRHASVSRIDYAGGRPGAPQWQTRYEYAGAATQPARVLRPSVVAGKQAVVTITYAETGAAAGKPMSVGEDGFVPSTDPHLPAATITRTVDYRYAANGEVARIDGPLANASLDATAANSDITRTDFDPVTKLPVRIVHPGNRMEEVLQRDAALRPRVVRITDGDRVRTVTLALNWRGQPEQVEIAGAPPMRHRYDVNGRPLDADDVPAPDIQPALDAALAGTMVDRDPQSRPVAWHDAGGAVAVRTDWGAPGTAAQASLLAISAGSARAERLLDDFGRVVAIRNPDQGWQVAQHDAAGRIVDSIDPRGARQHAEWDAGGRLLKLVRYAPGASAAEQTVTYRYTGSLPRELDIADADGTRVTRNEFDSQGRLVAQTLTITPSTRIAAALAEPVTLRHGWRYDAHGRLVARTFTDGAGATFELREDSDEQGRTTRIATHGVLPAALGGGRVIAAAIGWKDLPTGPFAGRIAHGDGSVDEFDVTPTPAAPDAPRFLEASLDMGDGSGARRSPGRDTDAAGLPAAITTATADQHLAWDAAGHLARAVRADGNTHYVYDAQGQRVARIVTDAQGRAAATLFFHHDHQLVAETDAQGRMQYAYAYLGWRPLAQLDLRDGSLWSTLQRWLFGAPVRHLHTDRAGKVTDMTQDGTTIWRDRGAQEAPLRRAAGVSFAGVHQPLRYVGQYHDDESGLVYHGARYFDPGSGRFLSPDPAGIADATSGVPAPLLLDLYAYAGGRPDEFFDPDGAARIRYFAITVGGANGAALGTNQGYTVARWAFIVDNVQAGVGVDALGQKRNEYARNGTGLLVDVNGNFLAARQSAATWTGGDGMADMFTNHYGSNLISIPEFTITMDDNDATKLIASYIAADRQVLGNTCPARSLLLPQIKFAAGEANIDVTNATANGAHKERILACGEGSSANLEQRRVAKYEAAAEVNETARINRNCSADGCPGIGYYCDATKCFSPRDQLAYGPPQTTEPVHTPSYGRSQFIGSTLVSELLGSYNTFPTDVLTQLGLTPRIRQLLRDADTRARNMAEWWRKTKKASTYAAANQAWANLPAAERTRFTTETGLGERAYVDMVRIKTQPPRNSNGDDLSKDAAAAFGTDAIMSNSDLKSYLMGIFKDFDKFTVMSHALMRKNMNAALRAQPSASEEYLAAMVARAHNGGTWNRTYDDLKKHDSYNYVKNFIGIDIYTKKGDWKSLRCTDSFGTNTVKPGTNGKGIGGLEMKSLQLN